MPASTVNFSVPEDVKEAFNDTFAGENKSAIITRLMQEAIAERQREHRRSAAIDALLDLRRRQSPVAASAVRAARREGRP